MFGVEIFLGVVILFVLIVGMRSVRHVPQARVAIVQRLGWYHKTAGSGPVFVLPLIDRILPTIDLREQVVPFEPQPVITADNVGIEIATVVYYQIIDAKNASYEVANLVGAMEQLTITTLRNVIGGLAQNDRRPAVGGAGPARAVGSRWRLVGPPDPSQQVPELVGVDPFEHRQPDPPASAHPRQ